MDCNASNVLPPFSGKLRVDKKLKLSHDDFKQSIETFYGNKQLSPIDQLKATHPYPTPHVLAQFASMAYRDCRHEEPKPPDGWQLLTTASNFGIKNGYFGTAYWHPEHQQVVIVHRGTVITNVGALVTDVKGVLFNNYVQQMSSASTFANKVVAVLQEIEQEEKVSFELFFTGHSLGGWLAQITTFVTEYLEVIGGIFLKKLKREQDESLETPTGQDSHDIRHSFHPHTVVFDSPGCKDMLSKMADRLDVRLHESFIYLQQLDITSYLSAPNLINTCHSHLGTVYRVLTDLSDMGWKEKHTPLYNKATHSMDKIVEAFDHETGQVRKDDEGRLKIREVVDWPVSTGLSGGAEYNEFRKWAEHLSNYHADVMDTVPSKVPKGYHWLRYQTKAYDECTRSLRVFTQDEREFLERYRWLSDMKDFVKPEDLFCVMNNAEAEKEAEQKLRNFEIGNESFRSPDANTLHGLIPYVKRLIRLFPDIKEKLKDQLSSPQIRKGAYQYETQRYVEKIRQNALDFNIDVLYLKEFFESGQQIWQIKMVDGDAWTGITKVYRVLQKTFCTPNYSSEGHYTILKLKRLLTVNRMTNLSALLASIETPHLLMIACGTNQLDNDELENIFQETFNILKEKNTMKIILTTQSEDNTAEIIEEIATETLGEGFITTDEQLTWSDLTASSKGKLLEKTVIFQGTRVALNQLTSAESMTDYFPLADLLKGNELTIGKEPVLSNSSGYNEKCYIDRTFNHNIVIRKAILSDKKDGKFSDLLVSTEKEFKEVCQKNSKKNVHWLVEEKSGELFWQQSQGNLQALRKYIDAQKSLSYAPSDLDKLLQQAKNQIVMLIADTAGMGKTTVVTHLSKRIKQKYPAQWLVRIDLNDYTELFKAQKGKKMDKGRVLEFVSKEVLKLESHLEKDLFKKSFEVNEISKVVVMVDGFDEISPNYKETVIEMLQILKQTSLEQLWVTTRHHLKEELEDKLLQLSYTLQPLSEVQQVEFLKKFWLQTSNFVVTNQHRLQIFAKSLIKNLAQSISDKDREFTGIPLQTRMLAEAFKEEFISFYLSEKSEPELPQKLDLIRLYLRFINRKYDIYYEEKCKTPAGNVAVEGLRQYISEQLQEEHERLALETLFTEDEVTFLKIYYQSKFSDEELARIGIVQKDNEGKPQFIHRTFAEYFVAEFLINHLTKETKPHPQVQEFLVGTILLRSDCQVIRAFLDGLLEKCRPTKEALNKYGEKLDEQWNETEVSGILVGFKTALHEAAEEDNANIIELLLDSLQSGEHTNPTKKMLFGKDDKGRTAWDMAAENDRVQALKKIWKWAEVSEKMLVQSKKEHLNANELKNKLLLSIDKKKYTAWHRAAREGRIQVLETLWCLAKEVELNTNELLLARSGTGYTAWEMATEKMQFEVLKKMWDWAKEAKMNPDGLKNKLLLAKDSGLYTAWHRAAEKGSLETLETLWNWAKEVELNRHELLLDENYMGYTAWQFAVREFRLEVLKKLWVWANEVQPNTKALKKKLLLSEDGCGHTAWHRAAKQGSLEALEILWRWAMEVEVIPEKLFRDLVYRVWQTAVGEFHLEVLKKLWIWANEVQPNRNELKNKLLLAKDWYGYTAWDRAAERGNIVALEILWNWAKEAELNPEELLLAQGGREYTAWKVAVRELNLEVLKKLWIWANEQQPNRNALKKELLLAKDRNEYTAWHWAAHNGSLEVLEILWSWAKEEEINPEELLLEQGGTEYTAWKVAVEIFHLEVLKKLWVWANEVQPNPNALKNKLLLAKDRYGYTAWLRAVDKGNIEALEILRSWVKEAELNPEELFLDQSRLGYTAWQMAAKKLHLEMLKELWDWTNEVQLNPNALKNNLLLFKDRDGYTVWHRAAESGSLQFLETLCIWAKEAELNPEELLLVQSGTGYTAWQMAAQKCHLDVLKKLWDWTNEVQRNPNALKNKLLLSKDMDGYTAWHRAAENGSLQFLETLLIWAKEAELNPEELLLVQSGTGYTAWQMAAQKCHLEVLKKLWDWTNEVQRNPNALKNKLLLSKDMDGYTAWHRAAENGSLQFLETLLIWAKEAELNPEELLLVQSGTGYTAWQMVAQEFHLEVLKKLWVWAKTSPLNPNELRNKFLLAKDKDGYTVLHRAAQKGNLEALEALWSWTEEVELKTGELLSYEDNMKRKTSWQFAAITGHFEILQKLWVWAKEKQMKSNELKNKMLLFKDKDGNTAFHLAAQTGKLEALEIIWSWAKEVQVMPVELLLLQNKDRYTAWQLAAKRVHLEILEKLWEWAKEAHLNPNELKNKFLLSKDPYGNTAWHRAAKEGNLKALETLWGWAKQVELNTDDVRTKWLADKNEGKVTVWNMAAVGNHAELLKKLWVWAREVQLNPCELKKNLLLAKDDFGNTVWHRAAERGCLQELEILCSWTKEAETNTVKMKNKILLARNEFGETAWDIADRNKDEEVTEKLWEIAKEAKMNLNDLKYIQKQILKNRVERRINQELEAIL